MPIRIVTCLMQWRHGDNLFVQLHIFHSHYCTLVTVGLARENCGGEIAVRSLMSSGEVARLRGANGVTRRRGLRCASRSSLVWEGASTFSFQ